MPGLIKFLAILAILGGVWWVKSRIDRARRLARERHEDGIEDMRPCPKCGVWRGENDACKCSDPQGTATS